MDLKVVNQKIKDLELPDKQKESILELIDLKTKDDMDKLVSAIEKLDHKLETSIGALKAETKIVYWIVGIAFTVITFLISYKK